METFIIYGISDCPSCLYACADLMAKDYQYVFVNTVFSKDYRTALCKKFTWQTFPIVVRSIENNEEFIGGYDELKAWLARNVQ